MVTVVTVVRPKNVFHKRTVKKIAPLDFDKYGNQITINTRPSHSQTDDKEQVVYAMCPVVM